MLRMHHKIIENWIAIGTGMSSLFIGWININWSDLIPKVMMSLSLAFFGGLLGYFGKLVGVWCLKKIRSFFNKKP